MCSACWPGRWAEPALKIPDFGSIDLGRDGAASAVADPQGAGALMDKIPESDRPLPWRRAGLTLVKIMGVPGNRQAGGRGAHCVRRKGCALADRPAEARISVRMAPIRGLVLKFLEPIDRRIRHNGRSRRQRASIFFNAIRDFEAWRKETHSARSRSLRRHIAVRQNGLISVNSGQKL